MSHQNLTSTENGAVAFISTESNLLDLDNEGVRSIIDNPAFISRWLLKIDQILTSEEIFTLENEDGNHFASSTELLIRYLIFLRAFRGSGKGEKTLFRIAVSHISEKFPSVFNFILKNKIVENVGCWSDYLKIYDLCKNKKSRSLITDHITLQLISDLENLSSENSISLCAKWMPSKTNGRKNGKMKNLSFYFSLSRKITDKVLENPLYQKYQTKDIYRNVMTSLRQKLNLVESLLSSSERPQPEINYKNIPSKASLRYAKTFSKRDPQKYRVFKLEQTQMINKVLRGENVESSQLLKFQASELPDLYKMLFGKYGFQAEKEKTDIADLQFSMMLNDALQKESSSNYVVIADLSGSMSGKPMDVSASMAIFSSCLNAHQQAHWVNSQRSDLVEWKNLYPLAKEFLVGHWYSFSDNPKKNINCCAYKTEDQEIISIPFSVMISKLNTGDWGMSTNFEGMFMKLLDEEHDYDSLIVISDMQFNKCVNLPEKMEDKTTFQILQGRFREKNKKIPTVIFWNVRSSDNVPVTSGEFNTILVSGYNQNILKAVLDNSLSLYTPFTFLLKTLANVDKILKLDF